MPSWLFGSLRHYDRAWLRGDLVAGLTVWAVLVPEALAYASIAGVSPVVGLYAAPGALLLYAALGSSRHLVTGPMSATAALSAATVGDLVAQGQSGFAATTAALAVTTGILALVAGLLRLGFLAGFISEPVLKGFIVGLALTIIVGQLPKLAGLESGSGDFFEKLWDLIGDLGDADVTTLAVGLLSLAVVLGGKRLMPAVPWSLVAVALGVIAVKAFSLDDHGVAIVGQIDSGLPSFGLPDVDSDRYLELAAGAAGIALVGFAEGLGAAKTYAARDHYDIEVNRELTGLGGANLAAGLSSGMVVNGSLSKTAVNGSAGAHSQLSGLLVAALTIVTLLLLTGLFESLPEATLAAVVVAAVIELVDVASLRRLYGVWTARLGTLYGHAARADFIAAIAAMLGVLVFDTLPGLFIGIGVSMLLLVYRVSRPNMAELGRVPGAHHQWTDLRRHPDNDLPEGIVVLRPEGPLIFADADHVRAVVRRRAAAEGVRAVVLDLETVPFVDVTAASSSSSRPIISAAVGVQLLVARDVGQVRDVLRTAGEGGERVFPTVGQAVAAAGEA